MKKLLMFLGIICLSLGFTSCGEKEGDAERAGKELDRQLDEAERDYRDWRDSR